MLMAELMVSSPLMAMGVPMALMSVSRRWTAEKSESHQLIRLSQGRPCRGRSHRPRPGRCCRTLVAAVLTITDCRAVGHGQGPGHHVAAQERLLEPGRIHHRHGRGMALPVTGNEEGGFPRHCSPTISDSRERPENGRTQVTVTFWVPWGGTVKGRRRYPKSSRVLGTMFITFRTSVPGVHGQVQVLRQPQGTSRRRPARPAAPRCRARRPRGGSRPR